MAIQYIVGGENQMVLVGLAADTKPTSPATGLMFIESDTGKTFYADAAAWVEKFNPGYAVTSAGTPTGGTSGQLLKKNSATNYDYSWATVAGTGDVVGPIVSVASQIALFDGITGKLIKADTTTGIVKSTAGIISAAINSDLPVMSATVGGAVPTPPNNTTTFLRGDGTFAAPPGGGSGLTQQEVLSRVSFRV